MSRTGPTMRRRLPALASELALIGALASLQLAVTIHFAHQEHGNRPIEALAVVLLAAGPLALLLRHVHPGAPITIVAVLLACYLARGYWGGPVFLAFAAALVIAELAGSVLASRLGATVVVGTLVVCLAADVGPELSPPQVFGITAWTVVIIAISAQVRLRRDTARQRAERRAEESRRIASEGRLQLARDLHDVLAHSLSVINVQAGVALHLIDDDPAQVRSALSIIKSTSRDTLTEVREALDALRGTDAAEVTPTVGLHNLDRLIDSARPAGLHADVRVEGTPRTLPTRVDIAAYRIVQESLTNVTKHSAADHAEVTLAYEPNALVLSVHDPGPPTRHAGAERSSGHGIQGMRERAADLGGRLTAGRRFDGFTVRAEIPIREYQ